MPKLKKFDGNILRRLNHSNGLAHDLESPAQRSGKSFVETRIEMCLEPSIDQSVEEQEWTGRQSLCAWPEVDWMVLSGDGFEPIWDQQPLTSSMLLAQHMMREGQGELRPLPELAYHDPVAFKEAWIEVLRQNTKD